MTKKLLLPGAIILMYVTAQYLYTSHYARRGKALSQITYTGERVLGSGPERRLFVAGDSIAAGVGASNFNTSVIGRVAGELADGNTVRLTNISSSGARMADLHEAALPSERQDIIILIIGSNDLLHLTDLDQFKLNTSAVVARYAGLTDRLIIMGPGDIGGRGYAVPLVIRPLYAWRHHRYADIFEQEADRFGNATYINPLVPAAGLKGGYGRHTSRVDQFHLSDEGQRYWADLIKLALA